MYSIHLSISRWEKQFLVLEAVFQPHLGWKWTLTASRGLRPLEAIKSFISCPCEAGKQPLTPKIIFLIRKMTNEWSKVLIFRRLGKLMLEYETWSLFKVWDKFWMIISQLQVSHSNFSFPNLQCQIWNFWDSGVCQPVKKRNLSECYLIWKIHLREKKVWQCHRQQMIEMPNINAAI